MFDPQTWASHLTAEQIVRLAEALPSLMTAGAALSASVASLVVAIKARQAAHEAQRTADDATDQAREAAKEQILFALQDVVRQIGAGRVESELTGQADITHTENAVETDDSCSAVLTRIPPEEGGSHE